MVFIGYDIGYIVVIYDLKIDSLIGIFVGNMIIGISIVWWKKSYNVYYIVINSVEFDLDI